MMGSDRLTGAGCNTVRKCQLKRKKWLTAVSLLLQRAAAPDARAGEQSLQTQVSAYRQPCLRRPRRAAEEHLRRTRAGETRQPRPGSSGLPAHSAIAQKLAKVARSSCRLRHKGSVWLQRAIQWAR